jgi:soluble lytic murein transglycosylase-like protein
MAVPYLACMALVASLYHLPPRVLPSIQLVEGGTPGNVHRNTDGSDDYGVMQINSIWVAPLAAYTGLPREAVRTRLILWPCFNIAAAGAILRAYLNETRGDLMLAIGDYHSHTPPLNRDYQIKVLQSATRLFVAPQRR